MKMHPMIRERVIPAVAATGVAGVLAAGGWYGYHAVANQPVRQVVFLGYIQAAPADALEEFERELKKRTVGTSLESVRENARRIPWVRDAAVRRRWPDAVEVRLEEYRALARWNDRQLVSPSGEIFTASTDAELPSFHGPDASAPAMTAMWPTLVASLAAIGSPVREARVSPRGAWDVTLASGLRLVLGHEDITARARRFAAAWPQVAERGIETKYADLRYPNGFALRQASVTPALSPALSQGRGSKKR
jgi:cell division protein FtsQ